MSKFLRIYGAIAAATLLVAGCALRPPLTTLDAGQTQVIRHDAAGAITVPLSMPALGPDRGVQYTYNNNMINTVEVRLRDSLGNESVQYVVRNAYLASSTAAATVPVTFHNVLPGVFTLTVRTSHQRLLSATGPVKYDGLRDVFFLDGDADDAFDASETEVRVINGNRLANFLVFAPANLKVTDVLPWSLRSDTSTVAAGFGLGAATQSINPGTTTTVTVNMRQAPQLGAGLWGTTREVTAGEVVSLAVKDAANLQAGDQVALSDPSGFTLADGIADIGSASLHVYSQAQALDTVASTISFMPTRATIAAVNTTPGAWRLWLSRGQAVSETGYTTNYANAPRLAVFPALADAASSRFYASTGHVSPGNTATVYYDLRDRFGNLVAGNVTGINQQSLAAVRLANAGITMDYSVVGYSTSADPRTQTNPFILPGRTMGTVNGSGTYTQGLTAPGPITTAATYSVSLAGGGDSPIRMTRLDVPYYIYDANKGSFGPGNHSYTLKFTTDPVDGAKSWVYLERTGGPVIASKSISTSTLSGTSLRTLNLELPGIPPNTSPTPILPNQATPIPVILSIPANESLDPNVCADMTFNVTSYGARKVSEADTVRARVLDKRQQWFIGDVEFQWLQ